jgi:hypothetical protein
VDSGLLPAPDQPARPLPWRTLCALLVPAAALAAGVGLQRYFEGAAPAGDALLRWLLISGAAGLLLGLLAGLQLARRGAGRAGWALYGALSPFAVAALVLGAVAAVRPVRDAFARRGEARCLASGRTLCTVRDFTAACTAGARDRLGAPLHEVCAGGTCTRRWLYAGPWTPDNYVAPGSVLCSVVSDAAGRPLRHTLLAGTEQP